ncbi:40S ribosomal protein S12 [Trichuris trichiura]|uniref:40S ribosomal protein S12 n=1 Tax=Trichuris trichiura TaxID=36087 RepID=A0A077ZFS5_TRITR|nr:40S ribosomal protein S12 [Trichuris trichiura]
MESSKPTKEEYLLNLREVLKCAIIRDGLVRGLHEAAKALDKREALLCILAEDCDEPMYVKLVEALCTSHGIRLARVPKKLELGEWVGLCQYDRDGNARKIVKCSCVVIKDYGEETSAHDIVNRYLESVG